MKLSTVFFIGSILLFASSVLEAKTASEVRAKHEKPRAEHRHDRGHHREHRHRDHHRGVKRHHRYHGHRHDHRGHRIHHGSSHRHPAHRRVYRHRHDHDAFWGGLVIGGAAASVLLNDDYCPDHDRYHRYGQHRDFVTNRHGECFRVEYRRHRDVYIEVPRYKCY